MVVNNTLQHDIECTRATKELVGFLEPRTAYVVVNDTAGAEAMINLHGSRVAGVILSGSDVFVSEQASLRRLNRLIMTRCRVPILGICFGHQLLALATGGRLRRMSRPRIGHGSAALTQASHPLVISPQPGLYYYKHQECVASVPEGQWLVQGGAPGMVTVMRHRRRPWYGVQFHPELSGPAGTALLESFLRRCHH